MKNKFPEDLEAQLQDLKRDILNLRLGDKPSRTQYQNLRDKSTTVSPTTLMNKTKMTWRELLDYVGLSTDGIVEQNNWSRYSNAKIMDMAIEKIRDHDVRNSTEYEKKRRQTRDVNWPSLAILQRHSIKYSDLVKRNNKKYPGSPIKTIKRVRYTGSKDKLLTDLVSYIRTNDIKSWFEFRQAEKTDLPSDQSILRRTGMKYNELTEYIQAHGAEEFGEYTQRRSKQEIVNELVDFLKENKISTWKEYSEVRSGDMLTFKSLINLVGSTMALNITIETLSGIKMT
jgi:hypothetical protein